jgi:hypothetical protein
VNRRQNNQDITWFLDLRRNNQIDLTPPYQRRSVWTPKDRKFFIDTIFRNYPSPAIFLHKTISTDGKTTYHVVDGKQRLETILLFVDDQIRIPTIGDTSLNGKKWSELAGNTDHRERFWNYILPVEYLDPSDGVMVEGVFERLNRNSRKLERQELRHAKFDGWLIKLAEAEADKDEWTDWKVSSMMRARRMKDVQFISELLLVLIEKKVFGFDQDELDRKYGEYEAPSDDKPSLCEPDVEAELREVKKVISEMETAYAAITDHARTFSSFYTLWCLICIESDIRKTRALADNYIKFMTMVEKLESASDVNEILGAAPANHYADPYKYLQNSRGASTDLSQRQSRFEALRDWFRASK